MATAALPMALEFAPYDGQRAIQISAGVHRVEMTARSPSPPPTAQQQQPPSPSSAGPSGPRRVPLVFESPLNPSPNSAPNANSGPRRPLAGTSFASSSSSDDADSLLHKSEASSATSVSSASSSKSEGINGSVDAIASGSNGTPNGTPRKAVNGTLKGSVNGTPKSVNGTPKASANGTPNGTPTPKKGPKAKAGEQSLCDPEDIVMDWPTLGSSKAAGLDNPGMACYTNASLQVLLHTPPLLNDLAQHEAGECPLAARNAFCMACAMRSVAKEHWSGKRSSYKPNAIHKNLGKIKQGFSVWRQEDSHEFLRFATDALQNSALAGLPKNLPEKVKCTSSVYRMWGGRVRSRVLCLSCKKPSDTFDSLLDLSLDIPRNAEHIYDLLDNYIHKERLDGDNKYKCDNCKRKSAATKQLQIDEAPPVLTLHLKRFGFNWKGMSKKINKPIELRNILDIKPYMVDENAEGTKYRLHGVICHHGGTPNSGHYTSYVRGPSNQWFCADDDDVRQVALKTVLRDSDAYVLNYVRISAEDIAEAEARRANAAAKAAAPASPAGRPPSPGPSPAPNANGAPDSGTPKSAAALRAARIRQLTAPKAPSALGKRTQRDDDDPPTPNKRPSPPRAATPNGHAPALASLAAYGNSSDGEADPPVPGAFPASPRPSSPRKRKHRHHAADPKRGLHGVSKGAPMPFAVGRLPPKSLNNLNMRTNGMLSPKGSPSKREAALGRQKGMLKRMQGR